jgi:hypothetical protein|tara:strand:- start:76 stop:348 length:273 start_codon:yes stop_codon:yes gene_type:complete
MANNTQKHMGKNKLVKRLAAQVESKPLAVSLLRKRGDMKADGTLTAKGKARNKMTAGQRAIDRASKRSGRPKSAYKYNASTNRATLKSRK